MLHSTSRHTFPFLQTFHLRYYRVINKSIFLHSINRSLLFHVLSKVTRLFFEQFLSRKLNNVCYGMLGRNSDWEPVNLKIIFKCIQDKYLKIIYSINKNNFYGHHVTPSLLLPVCNIKSATTHFVDFFFFYFLLRVLHVILWNKGEFLENRLCDVTYSLEINELLSALFTFFF
jgi:hypothetical protein